MLIPNSTAVVDVAVANLLIIEDHPMVGRVLQDSLENIGFQVTLARNLAEARRKITSEHTSYDAVLLDGSVDKKLSTPLIGLLKQLEFKKPIVGISLDPDTNKILMKAGCTHTCEKGNVLEFVPALFS